MPLQFMLSQPPAEASALEKCALARQDAAAMISLALGSLTLIWPLVGAILLKLPLQLILECATWPVAFFAVWRVARQYRMLLVLAVNTFCIWLQMRFGFMGASSTAFFCFALLIPAIIFEGRSHFKKIAISIAMPTCVLLGITLAYFFGRLPVRDVDMSKRALKPSQIIAVDVLVLVTLIVVLILGVGLILQVEALNVSAHERDLETRDRAQGELTVSLKNEKEMKALHQAFAAATLHEIRNPCQNITAAVELLMKAALPPDQRALLTAVSGQTELLNSAANEIIDLHQIMQKKFRKVAIKFDPSELAFECAEAITFSVIYSPIEIVVCCQPSVPKFIRGDARRLKQIILNLAWNAVKSTTVGFVRINVSASSADAKPPSEAVTLHIAVVDSGRGIAASDLSMLFQSWQQINPANELSENVRAVLGGTSLATGGWGMGLWLSRHIAVDILGGNLGVRSDGEGRGAEFFVDAPFEVLELQKDMASDPGMRSILRGKKVLISDRPESMLLLRDILTPFGAECVCMEESTPRELEAALDAHESFDVVLVYASVLKSICEAEWVALVEMIERRWPHCVAILLHSLGHGFLSELHNISKPVRPNVLLDVLSNCLIARSVSHEPSVRPPVARASPQVKLDVGESESVADDDKSVPVRILAPLHILAVEDNILILKMLEMMIKSWKDPSIELDTAHDGVEALACIEARATRFDLILTDVNMPRMSGLELLARMREMGIDTPVIILTGSALTDSVENNATTRQGSVEVLHKPVSSAILRKAIARVMSEHKLMLAPVAEVSPRLASGDATADAAANHNREVVAAEMASGAKSGA